MALLCGALLVFVLAAGAPEEEAAAGHFFKGRELVDANSGDSALATLEGLIQGAEEVEKAIALGYSNRVSAYNLLGFAWRQVALWEGRGEFAEPALSKARNAYRAALALAPRDVEALRGYGGLLKDKNDRLKVYRDILAIVPNDAGALFAVGVLLTEEVPDLPGKTHRSPGRISNRQREEGVRYLKRAARAMDQDTAEVQGPTIVGILESHRREKDAEEVKAVLHAKKKRGEER